MKSLLNWLNNTLQLLVRLLVVSLTIGWVTGSSLCTLMLVLLFFIGFDFSMYVCLKFFLACVFACALIYVIYVYIKYALYTIKRR